ncbi:MAG TPA: hemolysin family protein [Actinomycetota bacterium]|nr:hemolysin family protein [Actinomycetota bacterium]
MIEWLLLGVVVLMVAANALFVAAEFSLVTIDRPLVEKAAGEGDVRAGGILAALKSLSTQLSGAQLGITVTSLIVGFIAEPSLAAILLGPLRRVGLADSATAVAFGSAFILTTAFQMILGELVPKNLALARPYQVARAVAGPQRAFTAATGPLIDFLNGSANRILRAFGVEPVEELASARSPQELLSLVQRSRSEGTLESNTAKLLIRSFKFGGLSAADVMVPRRRVRTLSVDSPISDLVALARSTGHSRFPVLGEGVDDPVGVVHIKQAIAAPFDERSVRRIGEVMIPPVLVLESTNLDQLLSVLRGRGLQMAIVVDEYGGTAGIVTLEDLIEEIVGEIVDEHDRTNLHAHRRPDGVWSLSGLLRPDEARELTGLAFPESDDYDTLGGLMAGELGRIPKVGNVAAVTLEEVPVVLTVQRMDGFRVDRLLADVQADPAFGGNDQSSEGAADE